MAFAMEEVIASKISEMKDKQIAGLSVFSAQVDSIIEAYFDPKNAPTSLVGELNEVSLKLQEELYLLKEWAQFDQSVLAFVESVEASIEHIADRFLDWLEKDIITAKKAAALFGKSTSTIYRWIKQGKLKARKVKGKWQIIH